MFHVQPDLGKWSSLTIIFELGWFNHQLDFKWDWLKSLLFEAILFCCITEVRELQRHLEDDEVGMILPKNGAGWFSKRQQIWWWFHIIFYFWLGKWSNFLTICSTEIDVMRAPIFQHLWKCWISHSPSINTQKDMRPPPFLDWKRRCFYYRMQAVDQIRDCSLCPPDAPHAMRWLRKVWTG